MSIINNANPGSSIIILSIIDKYLRDNQSKQITLDNLKQHLRPDTLSKSENALGKYKENLNFWIKYGIWRLENEDEKNETLIKNVDEKKSLEYRVLRNIIASIDTKEGFLEENNVEPFLLYLTCLIDQDRYSFAGGDRLITGGESNIPVVINQYANLRRLPNSNETTYLIKWAQFLGFIEPDSEGYMLDPTRAIQPYLKLIFKEDQVLSIRQFLEKLSEYLPMFGGGRFIQFLTDRMHEPRSRKNQISAALTHALLRLEMMNKISFDSKSDDVEAMELFLPKGMPIRMVSTISWKGDIE